MVLMFGLIAIAGKRILVSHGIRRREAVIAGDFGRLGLWAAQFEPEVFKTCLSLVPKSPASLGWHYGNLLNLVLPEDKTEAAAVWIPTIEHRFENECAARNRIPVCDGIVFEAYAFSL